MNDCGINALAISAEPKVGVCVHMAEDTTNQLTHMEAGEPHGIPNESESTQTMPYAAAWYFDAVGIPHAHIFARSKNPWLGGTMSLSSIIFVLPYVTFVYGYLGNFNPVLYPTILATVPLGVWNVNHNLRMPAGQVNKSWASMTGVGVTILGFSVACIGTLYISVLPGGHIPGGNLLFFCLLLFPYCFILVAQVRDSFSAVLPFSKLNYMFFGYFDPVLLYLENDNKQYIGLNTVSALVGCRE